MWMFFKYLLRKIKSYWNLIRITSTFHEHLCTFIILGWVLIILLLHHHHIPEGLGVFPLPWSSKWSWFLHLFFGRPMFLRPFGLYHNACFGILFVSILCTCCSHFFWYCFISSAMFFLQSEIFQTEVVETIKTHVLRAVYEIMWKNMVEPDISQRTT